MAGVLFTFLRHMVNDFILHEQKLWYFVQDYRMSEGSIAHPEHSSFSDRGVIKNIRNGNVDAFEILIRTYQRYVFKIVNRHVPASDVQETAHQTFISAYRSLESFRGNTEFRSWLATIAV